MSFVALSRSVRALWIPAALALAVSACRRQEPGPRALIARFFDTAVQQDYASTWQCYDSRYKAKVDQDEYVRHRREASALQSWRILSLDHKGHEAEAVVELTFAPSQRLNRPAPSTKRVVEQMVREPEGWRIKVW